MNIILQIVIFDEATAHMDYAAHSDMNRLVRSLLPSSTVVSILHRTETISDYDNVIFMDKGQVVWQGTPNQLFCDDISIRLNNAV